MRDLRLNLLIQALDHASAPIRKIGLGMVWMGERASQLHHALHKLGMAELVGGAFFTGALVEGGHAVFEMVNKTAELGEQASLTAQKAGMSAEAIQRLGAAAKMSGIEQESLNLALGLFASHVARAAMGSKNEVRTLQAFGISIKDARGHLKPMNSLFLELADGFKRIPDGAAKTYAAMTLLGKGGREVLPMLNKGAAQLKAWGDQAALTGNVISNEAAEKAEANLRAQKSLHMALSGISIQVGQRLMDPMTAFMENLSKAILAMQPDVVKRLSDALLRLMQSLPDLIQLSVQLLDIFSRVAAAIIPLLNNSAVLKTVFTGLAALLSAQFLVAVVQATIAVSNMAKAIGVLRLLSLGSAAIAAAQGILTLIPAMTSLAEIGVVLDVVMAANPIGVIVLAVTAAVGVIAGLAFIIIKNWAPISGFFKRLWSGVTDAFSNAWSGLAKLWGGLPAPLRAALAIGGKAINFTLNPLAGAMEIGAAMATSGPSLAPRHSTFAPPGSTAARHQLTATVYVKADRGTTVTHAHVASSPGVVSRIHRGVLPSGG